VLVSIAPPASVEPCSCDVCQGDRVADPHGMPTSLVAQCRASLPITLATSARILRQHGYATRAAALATGGFGLADLLDAGRLMRALGY
jgi:hypothetical protein